MTFQTENSVGLETSSDEKDETSCLSDTDDEDADVDDVDNDGGILKVKDGAIIPSDQSDYSMSDQDSEEETRLRQIRKV